MIQALVSDSVAAVAAARLFLHTTTSELWATCCRETSVTNEQCARLWESALHAARTAKAVVAALYEGAGTSALYVDCPLERAHRDIHAVAQHISLAPMWREEAGRVRLGLEPNTPLFSR
jgi:alkylation response protein AidB-like acyl-CoA dehydrogenase